MVPIRKKQLHYRNCFRWWEQRESNPRPSACKADALNQLSYAPFFCFFWLITASDFVSSLLTTSRLLRRSSLVFLVLNQFFRFFFHIAASDFVSSVGHYREVTPSLLTRLPCTAKKQTSKLFLLKNCPLREVSPKGIAKVDKISVFPNFLRQNSEI